MISTFLRTQSKNGFCFLLYAVLLALASIPCPAQSKSEGTNVDELQARIQAAAAARDSHNPDKVASANSRVLALALRRLANIRVAESAFPQAAELYRRSLAWEDTAETHVGLAICDLYANLPDESLEEAAKALALDPNSARAFNIQGKAWMKKRDYRKAADSLQRSVTLHPDFEPAYALGVSLLSIGDAASKEQAAKVFDTIVASVGDSGSLRVMFGRAYRDAEMQDDSIRELRKAVALDTKTPHAHYFLGLSLLWKNEWADTPAIHEEFVTELKNYPHDFLANYFLGYLDSNDRHYDDANVHLKAATEIDPSWPEPWLFLGLNTYAQGDMVNSEKYLRKCIETTGTQESRGNYQVRRAYITLARILSSSGRSTEAAPYLKRAREDQKQSLSEVQQYVADKAADAGSVSAAAVVAVIKSQEDQPLADWSKPVDPSLPLDPAALERAGLSQEKKQAAIKDESDLRLVIASSLSDLAISEAIQHNYSGALGHFQEAERWSSAVPDLQRNLGIAAFRAQNYAECVRTLSGVVTSNPSDNVSRAMLGSAYFGMDDYRAAVRTIAPLADRATHDATLGYAWAASLARLGEFKEATDVLAEYEKQSLSSDAMLLVGQLWIEVGDYDRAVQTFHRALDRDPNLAIAHYFAGLAQLRWEHGAEAVEEFNAALKLAPDDPDVRVGLGYILMQQGKQDEAIKVFRSVVDAHPENGNAQYQLGKLLLDGEKPVEAVAYLEAAARTMPESDYVHYQLQAAYRKQSRTADADRELQIYKELKAKHREATVPRPMQAP